MSEPATDAVRHEPLQEREFEVAVTALADGSCLVEVSDEGGPEPRLRVVGRPEETGRDLHLVEHVATAWAGTAGPCGP